MPNDMAPTIVPKSDQLNADDLLTGPITIRITGVTVRGGQEQPVSISYEGDNGKPYKACKSMCRVMVSAWGADSSKYVGRYLTLYCDPKVKWGGMEVGGIRISHMSDIDSAMTMALTVTRANKKPFTVKPLKAPPQVAATRDEPQPEPSPSPVPAAGAPINAAGQELPATTGQSGSRDREASERSGAQSPVRPTAQQPAPAAPDDCIAPDQALALEASCNDNGVPVANLKKAAGVERLAQIKVDDYARALKWLDVAIAKRKQAAA